MDFAQQFIDGGLYRLPDDTLIQAQWKPSEGAGDGPLWHFLYFTTGESAIDVYASGLITQADPPHSADVDRFRITSIRNTRSDLSIEDIRPA